MLDDSTVTKCRSQKAAWKHCLDLTWQEPEAMAAPQISQQGIPRIPSGQGTRLMPSS